MQVDLSGAAWDFVLDQAIERFLRSGGGEIGFPTHAACSFESGDVVLRRGEKEIGRFSVVRLGLDDEIEVTLADRTSYPPRPTFTKPTKRAEGG